MRWWFMAWVALCAGCDERPSSAQLEAWREDAISHNERRRAEAQRRQGAWTLQVGGQVTRSIELSAARLDELATTEFSTVTVTEAEDHSTRVHYRGVPVRRLLELAGADPSATTATFVCFDSFRATLPIDDLRAYPSMIAVEANGAPIPRTEGGPLFLVHPVSDHPDLGQRVRDGHWAFYVTDVIVGSPELRLTIGDTTFARADVAAMPQAVVETEVSFKVGWPSEAVRIRGVRLRDVLAAADVSMSPGGSVVVRGRAGVHRDPDAPVRVSAADLTRCDILLGTHVGADDREIDASLGGPLVLTFPTDCIARPAHDWVTLVEELQVTP